MHGSGDQPSLYPSRELQVDRSNPTLGDIPIVPDHEDIEILNTRRKFCSTTYTCMHEILHQHDIDSLCALLDIPLRNCKELQDSGFSKSGLYTVEPGNGVGQFVVYCDMTLLGGGWTVIQRRLNDKLSFYQNYASYQSGFGDFAENLWLGLDKISRLTSEPKELYIGLEAFFSSSTFSRYDKFSVGNEASGYRLTVDGFDQSSTAGDSMTFHSNQQFSTYDRDQDSHASTHCAETFKGGWWYNNCHKTNLNGRYYGNGQHNGVGDGLSWTAWVGDRHSLKSTLIAIR